MPIIYTMRKYHFLIIIGLLISYSTTVSGAWSCSIENGPPPELAEYMRTLDTLVSNVSSLKDACSGDFKSEKKDASQIQEDLVQFYDEVDIQSKLWNAIVIDFEYNIGVAFDGNARASVMSQWALIEAWEKKIQQAFEQAARTCNLGTVSDVFGGIDTRTYLKNALTRNRSVVHYYKSVVTWDLVVPEGIDDSDPLFLSIALNYSPSATASCENEYSFEKIGKDMMTSLDGIKTGITKWLDWWKKAIALFQWTDRDTDGYRELQKKLLTQELLRQWLSQSQISKLTTSLTCYQLGTTKESTVEERLKVRKNCMSDIVWPGWKELGRALTQSYAKNPPRDTDGYLARRLQTQALRTVAIDDISSLWSTLSSTLTSIDETEINEQILSDLVSIHMRLVDTNALLKKTIPTMQENCMKAGPTVWWCR